MFPGAASGHTMGPRVGSCTHRRAQARTPGHTRALPPARCGGGEPLHQPAARGARATTKPPREAGEDGEDAGTASSILPAAAPPPASPGPPPRSPAPAHGGARSGRRRRKGSGRRRKWWRSVPRSGAAASRAAGDRSAHGPAARAELGWGAAAPAAPSRAPGRLRL